MGKALRSGLAVPVGTACAHTVTTRLGAEAESTSGQSSTLWARHMSSLSPGCDLWPGSRSDPCTEGPLAHPRHTQAWDRALRAGTGSPGSLGKTCRPHGSDGRPPSALTGPALSQGGSKGPGARRGGQSTSWPSTRLLRPGQHPWNLEGAPVSPPNSHPARQFTDSE